LWPRLSASRRDLAGGHLVALADDPGDLRPHLLDRDVERLEHAGGKTLLLAQETEEDVLRTDVVVLQRARFVLSEHDDLPSPLRESLEHRLDPLSVSHGAISPGRGTGQSSQRLQPARCPPGWFHRLVTLL
jgi:hypothetical protein